MSQRPTATGEATSQDSAVSTSSPSPFIYPIRSAVSVKPMLRNPSSDSASLSSGGGSHDGGQSYPSDDERTALPGSSKQSDMNRQLGDSLSTMSLSDGAHLPENPSGAEMDEDMDDAESSNQLWSEEARPRSGGSQESVEDSRMMREGAEEMNSRASSRLDNAYLRRTDGGTRLPLSDGASSVNDKDVTDKDITEKMTQPRFRHVETEEGHMIVTGRDGEIARCEDEPIHIPGAVQSFGCMVVTREDSEGMLVVRQVSENTGEVLGLSPSFLFSLDTFLDCLDDDQADLLWDNIEALDDSDKELSESGPHVFKLAGWGQPGPGRGKARARRHWECWCAIHRVHSVPQDIDESDKENPKWKIPLTVLEFELINDVENPLQQPTPATTPDETTTPMPDSIARKGSSTMGNSPVPSVSTLESDGTTKITSAITLSGKTARGGLEGMPYIPTPEQFVESTQSSSKPITALDRLRRQGEGTKVRRQRPKRQDKGGPGFQKSSDSANGDTLDMFGILSQVNEQLTAQSDLTGFLKVAVSLIREITGFSRVMIYQFDEQWNGQVVCELVDWSDTHDLYRGLHFPATDIPKQARDLYMINKVRLLYDRDQPSARMVCREMEDLRTPVNMTHSFLRAMSPIHIKYLANMGVRASMSISIVAFDQLWGLIALHTYGSHGKRVSFPMRQLCRLIGESISRNIERLSYTRRLSARRLINTLPTDRNPSGYIISNAEDLLSLFDADFGVIAIGHEAKILGPLSASQEVLAVTEYLRIKKFQQVLMSQDVAADFPDMVLPKGLEVIAGLLVVPLSSSGIDFITFLRKAQTRHVNWAGKPFKTGQEGQAMLEPRKSFKIWSETVRGKCRAWKDEELETASVLCLVYGKFISVWRQREHAMQHNQLNKLLLSNATHEVRTPLNHIINYLEMALDSQLDKDTRENLSKSHMASKSLLFVINDLLDLTRHEQGNTLFLQEPFDLAATIREAVEMHEWEARRRKIEFSLQTSPEKCFVLGDAARVRQILVNTVSNSVKHTDEGHIHIEMRKRTPEERTSELPDGCDMEVELIISDTGSGIPREKLEAIFREFEQVESVFADPDTTQQDEADASEANLVEANNKTSQQHEGAEGNDSGLGLGLAIVARVVKNMGGQLRVDSTVGEGSRFTYFLPFRSSSPAEAAGAVSSEGQMRRSNSLDSGASTGSSARSEINSLVEAISAPHLEDTRPSVIRNSLDGAREATRGTHTGGPAQLTSGRRDSVRAEELRMESHSKGASATGSSSARAPASRLLNSAKVNDGTMQVPGSAVPLRGVKVDGHQMDTFAHVEKVTPQSGPPISLPVSESSSSALGTAESSSMSYKFDSGRRSSRTNVPDFVRMPSHNDALLPEPSSSAGTGSSSSNPNTPLPSGRGSSHSSRARLRLAESRAKTNPASVGQEKLSALRVLVVEDDPINRMILKKRLGMDGHKVLLAVNGEDGVRQFEENGHEMDIILMDLQMPICNGQDACKRIRACEWDRDKNNQLANRPASHVLNGGIPILAVSATLDFQMRQEMFDIGMDGWVLKPIDFGRLKSIMRGITHLEKREEERWKPGHIWEKGGWLREPANRPLQGGGNPV